MVSIQHGLDPRGNKGRFLTIGIFPDFNAIQLHRRLRECRVGDPLPEFFRLAIGQAAYGGAHAGLKHIVDRLHHLAAGTEIGAEEHFSPLPRLGVTGWNITVVFFKKDPGIGQTELIDGLLHITHHEAILLPVGQGRENGVLDAVGVLVLIHHDLPEAAANFIRRSGWAGALGAKQQVQGLVLQVAKVQHPAAGFCTVIFLTELPHQNHQAPGPGSRLPQVTQNLPGIIRKAPQVLFQALFAGIAAGFYPFRQTFIDALSGKRQAAVVDAFPFHHIVPGGAFPQEFQLVKGVPEVDRRLFHAVCMFRRFGASFHYGDLAVQVRKQVVHQEFSPDRFPCVGKSLHLRRIQTALEPAVGVQVATGAVVYLQHNIRHQAVIPAQALGVHEGPEVFVLPRCLVSPIQQVRKYRLPDLRAFILIRHPEIRRQVQSIRIFPENIGAEAVDRGNLCQKQPLHLPL